VEIDGRIAEVEARVGKRLIVRSICTPERDFRGYVEVRAHSVIVEYAEELPGYFWGYELLEELLQWVESGGGSAHFYAYEDRLVRVPAQSPRPDDREG